MSSIPKVGDTHSAMACLYFSPQYKRLILITPPFITPGPQFVACCEPFSISALVTIDPVADAVASFELAKNEALRQYLEQVGTINEKQARFLAIESDLADTVGDDNAQA